MRLFIICVCAIVCTFILSNIDANVARISREIHGCVDAKTKDGAR